jgi:hypothetical protein
MLQYVFNPVLLCDGRDTHRRGQMKITGTKRIVGTILLALAAGTANADDLSTALGGGLGGAGGAAIGQSVGGKKGAIVGGAVGGALGAGVTTEGEGKTGAMVGGAVGGGAGAAIGQSVGGKSGAVVGAGVGGATGAVVGKNVSSNNTTPATTTARGPDTRYGGKSGREYRVEYDDDYCKKKKFKHKEHPGKGYAKGHYKC